MVTMLEQKLRKCLDVAQKCARIVSNYCGQDFESMKAWHVIGAGVVVHLILFYSIFDIYFTSPLVHGMTPVVANVDPPAKRLVLFVADGLRADKFFGPDDNNELRAAYLRSVIEDAGVWGVSHTRVPTESRPGHVALIAGFYEDVSAVAKGWKENPVEFDSVFNESRYTWSWGSPDILPMFAKGATGDHVMVNCYPPHLEDFAGGSNIMELDVWVFKEFKKFLNQAKVNETLNKMLKQDKLVFFLHLLGIDTHGHANKPDSVEYSKNIRYVDHKIQEVVYMLEDFYEHDRRTAYIVTSDHGMTDWGSHGAGDPHETLTPIVAWGAGIRKPKNTYPTCGYFHDNFCDEWVLGHKGRTDISQADVAPLMSFLIGAPLPLNSVGVLPLDYLNGTEEMMAEAAYANAAQILAQYQVKMRQVKDRTISFTFRPFKELPALSELEYLSSIRNLIARGWYSDAIHESKFAIEAALRGLRYYQTYDRSFLGVSITLGFLGWVGYVLRLVLSEYSPVSEMYEQYGSPQQRMRRNIFINQVFSFIGFVILFLLVVQSLPLTNYLYCLMPVVLWFKFVQGWDYVVAALKMAMAESVLKSVLIYIVIAMLGVEVAVMCFFYRVLVSFLLVAMGFWVFFTPLLCKQLELCICWLVSCVAVAVFPLLPVVGHNAYTPLVLLAGSLAVFLGIIIFAGLWRDDKTLSIDVASKIVLSLQLGMVALATVIVKVTTDRVADKRGPPFLTQCLSWFMLFAAPLLSLFTGVGLEVRLFSLALGLLVPYILLSITYEGLFLLFLMGLLCFWIKVESGLAQVHDVKSENMNHFRCDIRQAGSGDSVLSFSRVPGYGPNNRKYILEEHSPPLVTRHLELADLRRALFFIVLIVTGFFGTGNIASINSFDTASIYCFLTVFNPFVMGGMLMVKVLLPFMVVTCVLRTVQVVTRAPLHGFILLVSMLSSFMGLNFFFLVRDYGSWLEIGTSISHYIITMSITVFVSIMIGLSQLLTSASLRPAALRKLKCDDEEEEDDDHRS